MNGCEDENESDRDNTVQFMFVVTLADPVCLCTGHIETVAVLFHSALRLWNQVE